jgi:hypothetical protein
LAVSAAAHPFHTDELPARPSRGDKFPTLPGHRNALIPQAREFGATLALGDGVSLSAIATGLADTAGVAITDCPASLFAELPVAEGGEPDESEDLFGSELAAAWTVVAPAPVPPPPPPFGCAAPCGGQLTESCEAAGAFSEDAPAAAAQATAPRIAPAPAEIPMAAPKAPEPAKEVFARPALYTADSALMTIVRHAGGARPAGHLSFAARVFDIARPEGAAAPEATRQAGAGAPIIPTALEAAQAPADPARDASASPAGRESAPAAGPGPAATVRQPSGAGAVEALVPSARAEAPPMRRESPTRGIVQSRHDASLSAPPPEGSSPAAEIAPRSAAEPRPADGVARAIIEPEVPPVKPAAAVRHIALEMARDGETVRVNVVERRGEVHAIVRASGESMSASLRGELGELVAHVERAGMKAETWTPPAASPAGHDDARESAGDQQRRHSQDQSRSFDPPVDREREAAPRWLEELNVLMNTATMESRAWQPV